LNRIKVGLLPLYLALYDQTDPYAQPGIEAFTQEVSKRLGELDIDVVCQPICRVSEEFDRAADSLIDEDVCAVITLHLAYSPSLESISALRRLKVPIVVMDTTPDFSFDQNTPVETIMYNHGIHGVQDLCNLMTRSGITYFIEAGHIEHSDLLERIYKICVAADAALHFKRARVGTIGKPFTGMGDFQVPEEVLAARIGLKTVPFDASAAKVYRNAISEDDLAREMLLDQGSYRALKSDTALHLHSTMAGLIIRRWITEQKLTALTVNFMDLDESVGLDAMPVLEIDKGMSRGIGYAGEGDVLTAGLYGALSKITDQLTFSEMFCPDWKGQTIFMSHMAEVNPGILAGAPLMTYMDFPFTSAKNPAVLYGRYQAGKVVLVNLAPVTDSQFRFILVPGSIKEIEGTDAMEESVHGWFSPDIPIENLLQNYSRSGGTHHLVMMYGDVLEQLIHFGKMMGFEVQILRG